MCDIDTTKVIATVNDTITGKPFQDEIKIEKSEYYVLVAGLFYPGHENGYKLQGSFINYVNKRKKEIIKQSKADKVTKIITIDIHQGEIITTNAKNGTEIGSSKKTFDKVSMDNYKKNYPYFDFNGKNIIKKWDIYKIIEEIGEKESQTLEEFGIYSHAYFKGPILVDSSDPDNGGNIADDNDFRRSDAEALESTFELAFSPSSYMKIWGCSFPKRLNTLFSRLRKNVKYRSSGITDDEIFSYPSGHFYNQDLVDLLNGYLSKTFNVNDKIELTFANIKKIASLNYVYTYAATFASKFNIKVIAALPATYSDISPDFHISSETMSNVNFYKNLFNLTLMDNYGIYNSQNVDELKKYVK